MRRLAGIILVLALAVPATLNAQVMSGAGMITAMDRATRTLTLETTDGTRRIVVAPEAGIRGDRRALTWADLAPGDTVAYRVEDGRVTRLDVAGQFWAVPGAR